MSSLGSTGSSPGSAVSKSPIDSALSCSQTPSRVPPACPIVSSVAPSSPFMRSTASGIPFAIPPWTARELSGSLPPRPGGRSPAAADATRSRSCRMYGSQRTRCDAMTSAAAAQTPSSVWSLAGAAPPCFHRVSMLSHAASMHFKPTSRSLISAWRLSNDAASPRNHSALVSVSSNVRCKAASATSYCAVTSSNSRMASSHSVILLCCASRSACLVRASCTQRCSTSAICARISAICVTDAE
mmetsp:Transcript_1558/g.3478  ORF Transcript_1558/g.3478 Transcript_1558/m.3478 type:complete len:242 (+) Transcript_1558:1169-1894(+)